jgi:hypothetical protein
MRILLIPVMRVPVTIFSICLFSGFLPLSEPAQLTIRLLIEADKRFAVRSQGTKESFFTCSFLSGSKEECWSWYEYTAALWPSHAIYNWIYEKCQFPGLVLTLAFKTWCEPADADGYGTDALSISRRRRLSIGCSFRLSRLTSSLAVLHFNSLRFLTPASFYFLLNHLPYFHLNILFKFLWQLYSLYI